MKPDRKSNIRFAATPAGVVSIAFRFRGCRVAQPRANGWHPFGMTKREPGARSGNESGEPGRIRVGRGWNPEPRGFGAFSRWLRRSAPTPPVAEYDPPREPGGFGAFSRWLRRSAPTPPETERNKSRIPEGCQP
jgi:hypothetical protein